MNYEDELKDYLITALETFVVSDGEKQELLEYIEEIAKRSSKVQEFIKKDDNKETVISFIESLAEKQNV